MRDIEIMLQLNKFTNLVTKLSAKFHDYLDIFSKIDSDLLPQHQPEDHLITLMK